MALETSDASTASPTSTTFILAPELWLSVASHLGPKELMLLGETCRYLHDVINQCHVWMQALQYLCHQRHLFRPSFPTDQMGLAELRRAALGPHRWCKLIRKHHAMHDSISRVLRSLNRRILKVTASDREHPNIHYLVPGGRFLVVASRVSIEMWDLRVPGVLPLEAPHLVASHPIIISSEHPSESVQTVPEVDVCPYGSERDGLRIAVRGMDINWVPFIKLYEISPQSRGAVFRERGTLLFDAGFQHDMVHTNEVQMTMTDRFLFIGNNAYGVIWDFIGGQYRFWYIGASNLTTDSVQVIILQNHILHISLERVEIWSLSSLPQAQPVDGPLPASNMRDIQRIAPQTTLLFERNYPNNSWCQFVLPSSWYASSLTTLTFDVLSNTTYDDADARPLSARRYQLSLCKTEEWEMECLGDFTFPGCEGASAFEQCSSLLDLEFGDSSVTSIRTFTSSSIRQFPSQYKPAIYSVAQRHVEGVEKGQSDGGDTRGRVTTLQKQNAFAMWVCPVSGRVTWIPAPNTPGYIQGQINVESYFL